jgi:argininosuccinate lyase
MSVFEMTKSNNILREGRLGRFDLGAADFTSSIDIDLRLLDAVVQINTAHVLMLRDQHILDSEIATKLVQTLRKVPRHMKLSSALEDVHMNVEDYVVSRLGKNIGGMLNLAKSRNDQVATAIRIALREMLCRIARALIDMESALISKARQQASTVMPGYTHLQRAQPISVGHELMAHFGALERDMSRLIECFHRVNSSPMGSGALASSSFDLDREKVASLLGFEGLVRNSIDAVSSRDFAIETIYVCSQILNDLSKFAEELVLWSSKEFSFVSIPDDFASTSSLMPQKKNPIVPEIIRAKAAQSIGDLTSALGITKSLPLSYNLDLQELTRNLWSTADNTLDSLVIFAKMVRLLEFNSDVLESDTRKDESLYATELADYLVKRHQISFREAHSRVASLVKYSSEKHTRNLFSALTEDDLSRILKVSIKSEELESIVDPNKVLERRKNIGSPNPKLVISECNVGEMSLGKHAIEWGKIEEGVDKTRKNLEFAIKTLQIRKKSRMSNTSHMDRGR